MEYATEKRAGVKADDRRFVHDLANRIPQERGSVEGIFIHLERNSDPLSVSEKHPLIRPVKGGFQLSLALSALGLVDADAVRGAAEAVRASPKAVSKYGRPEDQAQDALARGLISERELAALSFG